MEQREKLIELLQSFQSEYPKSFDSLYYELAAEADHLIANGVVVLPCRCEECEHYSVGNCPMWDNGGSKYDSHWNGQYDGYCHKAKRKGGDE